MIRLYTYRKTEEPILFEEDIRMHEETPKIKKKLFSRKEAALYIGSTPRSMATWACTKKYDIKYKKRGGRTLYEQEELDRHIEELMSSK